MQQQSEEEVVRITLPKLTPAQRAVIQSPERMKVLNAGRQFGKTTLCKYITVKQLINDGKVCYITPTLKLARQVFDELLYWLPPQIIEIANKSELKIKLLERYGNGSIQFFSGQKEHQNTCRGFRFTYVVYDESAYIPGLLEFHNRIVSSTMLYYKASCIWISTPFGKGDFNALYERAVSCTDGTYKAFHYTTYDNPYLDPAEIEREREDKGEAAFREENLAIPGESQYNPFGIDVIERNTITELSKKPVVVYGIDTSAGKKDWSVVVGLDATGAVAYFERWKQPWAITLDKIQRLPNGNKVLKIIDATGTGSKLGDDVILSMPNTIGFTFNTKSKPEIMLNLIKKMQRNEVKVNKIIADEMTVFEYKINPKTQHIEFNAQSGYFDDAICAIAMALHKLPKTAGFMAGFGFGR